MRKVIQKLILRLRKYLPLSAELRYDYKKILLTVQITLAGIVTTFLFSLIDLANTHYSSAAQVFSAMLIFIFSIYLIWNGKIGFGKLLVIVYSCITLIINGSRDGRYAGNEFLWFPILSGVILFFSSREKGYMLVSFVISLFGIFFLEYTEYSALIYNNSKPELVYMNYVLSFAMSIIMVCSFLYYLIKVNIDSEKKMRRLNRTLLIRNQNLKKINNELDSFVYKASHDMRAPLTSLLGLIAVSKKETDIEVIRGFYLLQEKSIKKLDSYILDILNISRNARMEIERKEIDFNEALESVFEQLNYLEGGTLIKKNISIHQEGKFYSDETRINIIFSNLIANSIRYMDASKGICKIDIVIETNAKEAHIVIADNGTGIASEHLSKVFNMFYRASENNSGSGLGLYIVQETLIKLKGSIKVSSELGKYTSATIDIPNAYVEGK